MHRRQFISALAGTVMIGQRGTLAQDASPAAATPVPTPAHHGRPRPIILGDGIELIDYRIYPSEDVPRIIGEIVSTRDEMVDSPVVSVTFPKLGKEGRAYAPPVLPVMRPGESNMIFGVLPSQIVSNDRLEAAEFGLCSAVNPGAFSSRFEGAEFRFVVTEESYWQQSLNVRGTISNVGQSMVEYTAVHGIVRDVTDRYAGAIGRGHTWGMAPGQEKDFFLWASTAHPSLSNPYNMLSGDPTYSLELHMGLMDYFTSPGCA